MNRKETNTLAMGGICLALNIVFLFGVSFIPGIEMTLYAISSLFVAVMVFEKGPKNGLILYVAAVILGLLLVPNKLGMLPYICFFGYYSILKYFIEKIRNPIGQIGLKVAFFLVLLVVTFWGTKGLLLGAIQLPDYPKVLLLVAGVVFLLLYDLILTLLIRFYRERVKREQVLEFKLTKDEDER